MLPKAVLIAILLALQNPAIRKQQGDTGGNKTNIANPTPVLIEKPPLGTEQQANSTQQPKWWPPPPAWDIYWPTLGLVAFTAWTVWVARRTFRAINQQVMEMRKTGGQTDKLIQEATAQSIAAKRSVDVLINSERAWMDGEILLARHEHFLTSNVRERGIPLALEITNHGKTLAWLESWEIACGCLTHETEFKAEDMPKDTTYRNVLFASGRTERLVEFNTRQAFARGWGEIYGKSKTGVISVTLKYRDIVSTATHPETHETSFMYVYDGESPPFFRRLAHYNVYK